jgi:hypothetical protein
MDSQMPDKRDGWIFDFATRPLQLEETSLQTRQALVGCRSPRQGRQQKDPEDPVKIRDARGWTWQRQGTVTCFCYWIPLWL